MTSTTTDLGGSVSNLSLWATDEDIADSGKNYTLTLDSRITSSTFLLFNLPCGLLGNGAICWFVIRNMSLRTPTCLLICNLAVAGLVQSLVCAPLLLFFTFVYTGSIVQEASGHVTGVVVVCYIQAFLRYVSGNVIFCTTVCIAHERYHAIAKPFDKVGRAKRVRVTIPLTWICGIVLGLIGTLVFFDTMEYALCHHNVPDSSFGIEAQYGTFFIVPVGLLCVVLIIYYYSAMLWLVRKHLTTFKTGNIFSKNKVKPITEDLQQSKVNKTNTIGKEESKSVQIKAKEPEAVTSKTDLTVPVLTKNTALQLPGDIVHRTSQKENELPTSDLCLSENLPGTIVQNPNNSKRQPIKGNLSMKPEEPANQPECTPVVLHNTPDHQHHQKGTTTTKNRVNEPHSKKSINSVGNLLPNGVFSDLGDGRCLATHSISQGNHCTPKQDKSAVGEVSDNSQAAVKALETRGEGATVRQQVTHQSVIRAANYSSSSKKTAAADDSRLTGSRSILSLSSLTGDNSSHKNAREIADENNQTQKLVGCCRSNSSGDHREKNQELSSGSNNFSSLPVDNSVKLHPSSADFSRTKELARIISPVHNDLPGTSVYTTPSSRSNDVRQQHSITDKQPSEGGETLTTKDYSSRVNCCETGEQLPEVETTAVVQYAKTRNNLLSEKPAPSAVPAVDSTSKESNSQVSEGLDKNDTTKLMSGGLTKDGGRPSITEEKPSSIQLVEVYDIEGNMAKQNAKQIAAQEVVGAVCAFNPKNREKGRRKVEAHTAKMTALAMACFLFCWFPYPTAILVVFVEANSQGFVSEFLFNFYSVSVSLSIFASAINPLVYGFLNTQFKSEFQKLPKSLKSKVRCKQSA